MLGLSQVPFMLHSKHGFSQQQQALLSRWKNTAIFFKKRNNLLSPIKGASFSKEQHKKQAAGPYVNTYLPNVSPKWLGRSAGDIKKIMSFCCPCVFSICLSFLRVEGVLQCHKWSLRLLGQPYSFYSWRREKDMGGTLHILFLWPH